MRNSFHLRTNSIFRLALAAVWLLALTYIFFTNPGDDLLGVGIWSGQVLFSLSLVFDAYLDKLHRRAHAVLLILFSGPLVMVVTFVAFLGIFGAAPLLLFVVWPIQAMVCMYVIFRDVLVLMRRPNGVRSEPHKPTKAR